mgnify:CR=1 FL=1
MNILNKIYIILQTKWEFKTVKKQNHLIIGHDHSNYILKYIPKNKAQIISFKKINFYIFFKLFLEKKKLVN